MNIDDRRVARFLRIRWHGTMTDDPKQVRSLKNIPEYVMYQNYGKSFFWAITRLNFAVRDFKRAVIRSFFK